MVWCAAVQIGRVLKRFGAVRCGGVLCAEMEVEADHSTASRYTQHSTLETDAGGEGGSAVRCVDCRIGRTGGKGRKLGRCSVVVV